MPPIQAAPAHSVLVSLNGVAERAKEANRRISRSAQGKLSRMAHAHGRHSETTDPMASGSTTTTPGGGTLQSDRALLLQFIFERALVDKTMQLPPGTSGGLESVLWENVDVSYCLGRLRSPPLPGNETAPLLVIPLEWTTAYLEQSEQSMVQATAMVGLVVVPLAARRDGAVSSPTTPDGMAMKRARSASAPVHLDPELVVLSSSPTTSPKPDQPPTTTPATLSPQPAEQVISRTKSNAPEYAHRHRESSVMMAMAQPLVTASPASTASRKRPLPPPPPTAPFVVATGAAGTVVPPVLPPRRSRQGSSDTQQQPVPQQLQQQGQHSALSPPVLLLPSLSTSSSNHSSFTAPSPLTPTPTTYTSPYNGQQAIAPAAPEPEGYAYIVHWSRAAAAMQSVGNGDDWRFNPGYGALPSPYLADFSESVHEAVAWSLRGAPPIIMDGLARAVRPDLGVSAKRHANILTLVAKYHPDNAAAAAVPQKTQQPGSQSSTLETFRLTLLENRQDVCCLLGIIDDDAAVEAWTVRQQRMLTYTVRMSLPEGSARPPDAWPWLASAVDRRDWPAARAALASLPVVSAPGTLSRTWLYIRTVAACLEPDPDAASTYAQLVPCAGDVLAHLRPLLLLDPTLATASAAVALADLALARAIYGWVYLKAGHHGALEAVMRLMERTRRSNPDPATAPSLAATARDLWRDVRVHLITSLTSVHAWPAERIAQLPLLCAAIESASAGLDAVLGSNRPLSPSDINSSPTRKRTLSSAGSPIEPILGGRTRDMVRDAIAASKRRALAKANRELLQPVPPLSSSSSPPPRQQQHRGSDDTTATSLSNSPSSPDRLAGFLRVVMAGVKVDAECIWPNLKHAIPGRDMWEATVAQTLEMTRVEVVDRHIAKTRPEMGAHIVELMRVLVELEGVMQSARDAMVPGLECDLELCTAFLPTTRAWLSGQRVPFTTIVDRAITADPFTDPASDQSFHSESAVTVLQFANGIVSMLFSMPISRLPYSLIPQLITDLHLGVLHYMKRVQSSMDEYDGVANAVYRLNSLVYVADQWPSVVASVARKCNARDLLPRFVWMNLAGRLPRHGPMADMAETVARRVVEELPWTTLYMPVASAASAVAAGIPASLDAALEALAEMVVPGLPRALALAYVCAVAVEWYRSVLWAKDRVYVEIDWERVLDEDTAALVTVLTRHRSAVVESPAATAIVATAVTTMDDLREELAALMPMPSTTLVEWWEEPRERLPADLMYHGRIGRVLAHRYDAVAKSAVKKYHISASGGNKKQEKKAAAKSAARASASG
ncbi:hypothetical protein BC828DRAFT_388604 [Blastocladiella britannica]|nr:hypothetical protein BC828DRAFT_388604 [Blastocladiella britannica]